MRRQKVFHRLRYGEFQIHAPTVAKYHDEETQFPARAADPYRAVFTPVHLCGFARRERQFQKGRMFLWPDQANIVLDRRVVAYVAGFTQPLEYLLRSERMGVWQPGHLPFERIKDTGANYSFSCFVVQQFCPCRHRAMVQVQRFCDLCQRHVLAVAAIPDLAPGFIRDHARLPRAA